MLTHFMGLLPNASEHGFMIDNMLEFCHWFMLLLFVGWSMFFAFVLVRFHKSRNPKADYHGVKTKASTHIEFMVVLTEAILLLGFAFPLWGSRVNVFSKEQDAVHLRVIAQQFLWNFHYPGADGKFGKQDIHLISASNPIGLERDNDPAAADDIVVSQEMHVPLNKNVIVDVGSKDVVHSFAIPSMRVGQDAIPGLSTPTFFKPVKTGTFEIVCGQLCGANHYAMRGTIVVDSPEDYKAWLKETGDLQAKKAPATTAPTAPARQ